MLPFRKRTFLLWICVVAACVALSIGGHAIVVRIEAALDLPTTEMRAMIDGRIFLALLLAYVLLIALPFVPGAEIGILLLMAFGPDVAVAVYGATVAALTLSFLVGRLVPLPRLVSALGSLGLSRPVDALLTGVPLALHSAEALRPLGRTGGILGRILRYRCFTLGILFNTPGNSLIGGGGGIAFAVGASRLLTVPEFLVTVLIAVAPVPAAILFTAMLTSS